MFGSSRREPDARAIVPAPGLPGGPFETTAPAPGAQVLAQDLTFSWARTGTATVGNVVVRGGQGQWGRRLEVTMSLASGTLGMTSPALSLTLHPADSRTGVFHVGNFENEMVLWDAADPSRVWRSRGTGALSRTSDSTLLVQGVTLRDRSESDPHANRIRVDGTLRLA